MKINKEMVQPTIMMLGSCMNICGSIGAISVGADRTDKGINPFFYIALGTSAMYLAANAIKNKQIYGKYTEAEAQRREDAVMERV